MTDKRDTVAAQGAHTTKSVTYTCKHGEHTHEYKSILWAGPVGKCACCGQSYLYLESGHYGSGESGGKAWVPRNTCQYCGGHYQNWGDWSSVSIMNDKGDWVPAPEYDPVRYANLPTLEAISEGNDLVAPDLGATDE
jgi:hypothetical protein